MNEQIRHDEIIERLDKIIGLLEFMESINNAKSEMKNGEYAENPFMCNCSQKGKTSAVITCPVHG